MEELVSFIVRSLVDNPDDVTVAALETSGGITYEVTVAPGDMGKIIGRSGRVIQSIRTVVKAVAAKSGERAFVEIIG